VTTTDAHVFRFEGFVLDTVRRSLRSSDQPVCLRSKSFDVLCALVTRAGQVVRKDELMQAAWREVVVTDDSLVQCVGDIRRALGDGDQQIVKTVPRRGYLFAAPVQACADNGTPPSGEAEESIVDTPPGVPTSEVAAGFRGGRQHAASRRVALVGGILLLGSVAGAAWVRFRRASPFEQTSIVVMPFTNLAGDPEEGYFCDGLSEDVTTRLAKFRDLLVIAHESALAYKDRPVDPRRVGRELGVRYLIEGSVRRDARRVRISVRLVDAETGVQRWTASFDRELSDIFALQDEVTQKIVSASVGYVSAAEIDRSLRKTDSLAAYDHYLRGKAGLQIVDAAPTPMIYGQRLLEARQSLERSVALDSRYAPALAALSDSFHRSWIVRTNHSTIGGEFQQVATSDRALGLAQNAVSVDPYLAEAHTQLGWVLHWRYRRNEAIDEFQRAAELNPNLADGRFTLLLAHAGRAEEGIDYMKRVVRLDPFHRPIYYSYIANAYYLARRFQQALESSRLAVSRVPGVYQASVWHAAAAAQCDLLEEAQAAAARCLQLRPGLTIRTFLSSLRLSKAEDAALLGEGLRKAGLAE
jgi:adenylate cyclase